MRKINEHVYYSFNDLGLRHLASYDPTKAKKVTVDSPHIRIGTAFGDLDQEIAFDYAKSCASTILKAQADAKQAATDLELKQLADAAARREREGVTYAVVSAGKMNQRKSCLYI